mmetsp:Transcript_7943/g.36170  ORF Transcript_7943/g.36170 Transcript_7943/m.36170 type:complete len:332 (-) Transcript_7943:2130-3125(-)
MFSTSKWGLEMHTLRFADEVADDPENIARTSSLNAPVVRAAILGTGNIGCDILLKLLKLDFVSVIVFSGRRQSSPGIKLASDKGISCSTNGIQFFVDNPNCCDVVYDCTNANDAKEHSRVFSEQGITVIDLTPSKVGIMCVPCINGVDALHKGNVNMITCGGQAFLPLLYLISQKTTGISYVEAVSQIASKSAGMSTRINIDNYMITTEAAVRHFAQVPTCKVILNLNPAVPEVDMQTTVYVKYSSPVEFGMDVLKVHMDSKICELRRYIPGFALVFGPVLKCHSILVFSVRVRGSGDYLPQYAGNLDIINCAAIEVTKTIYDSHLTNLRK